MPLSVTTMRLPDRTKAILDKHAPPTAEGGRTALVVRLVDEFGSRPASNVVRSPDATIHDLKCWPADFAAIDRGDKTHEARNDDRGFAVGDVLRLHEWRPEKPSARDWKAPFGIPGKYSGKTLDVLVTHVTKGQYGLPSELAVMSIRKEPRR